MYHIFCCAQKIYDTYAHIYHMYMYTYPRILTYMGPARSLRYVACAEQCFPYAPENNFKTPCYERPLLPMGPLQAATTMYMMEGKP